MPLDQLQTSAAPSLGNPQSILNTQGFNLGNVLSQIQNLPLAQQQLIGLAQTPQQQEYSTSAQQSLQKLISLRDQLSKVQAPTEQQSQLDQLITQQQQALKTLNPEDFLNTQRGLKEVGITQAQLQREVASRRAPIERAYADLLMSRSVLGQQQQQQVQSLQSQIAAEKDIGDLQQALSQLGGTKQLPQAVTNKLLEQAVTPPTPTDDIKEYNLSKSQGFTGSFLDFKRAQQKQTGTDITTDPLYQQALFENLFNRRVDFRTLPANEKRLALDVFGKKGVPIPRSLSEKEKGAQADAISGLAAVDAIQDMFNKNGLPLLRATLPGPLARFAGASEFKNLRAEATDVKTRIRTGAALNESEIKFYESQAPSVGDNDEDINKKLNQLRGFYLGVSGIPVTIKNPKTNETFNFTDLFDSQQRLGLRQAINKGYQLQY